MLYIDNYDSSYLRIIHKNDLKSFSSSWKKFNELRIDASNLLNRMNDIIRKVINYDYMNCKLKKELYSKMDVKVCPYCNQQFVFYMTDETYLGDIDHVYPQSIYPLFSLSLWNLVPCCKTCNQVFKKDRAIEILNPTQQGFDDDAIFKVKHNTIKAIIGESDNFEFSWTVSGRLANKELLMIQNNIDLFRLKYLYKKHKDVIRDVLKKKYYFDDRFKEDYKRILDIRTEDELNFSIYGCSLNREKFKDEILSKMIYDIVKR